MTEPDQKAEGTNEVAGLRKEYKQSITSNQKRKYFFIIVVIALSAFSSWPGAKQDPRSRRHLLGGGSLRSSYRARP